MAEWILAGLALLGIGASATTPATTNDSTQSPSTAPSQNPVRPACTDGQPWPPTCGG